MHKEEILSDRLNNEWMIVEIGFRDDIHVNRYLCLLLIFALLLVFGVKRFKPPLLLVLVQNRTFSLIIEWHNAVVLDALE